MWKVGPSTPRLQTRKLVDFDEFVKKKLVTRPVVGDFMGSWPGELPGTVVTTVWGWIIKTIIQSDSYATKRTN